MPAYKHVGPGAGITLIGVENGLCLDDKKIGVRFPAGATDFSSL
jgi:hypothetical protein